MTVLNSNSSESSANELSYDDCIAGDHPTSGQLVARCYSAGDRTGHCIWWLEDGKPYLILKSIEGTSDQAWPESSPFQQIVCENVGAGGKPVLLGVGMAGKAHWSATIEGDLMTEAIAMDIACRTAAVPERLGSAYWVPPAWSVTPKAENGWLLDHPDGIQIAIDSIGNTPILFEHQKLTVHPIIEPTQHQRGQTYRWRYIVRPSGSVAPPTEPSNG